MTRKAWVVAAAALLSAFQARAAEDLACSLTNQECQFPDGGALIIVSAKVFHAGFGVEVLVVKRKWKMDDAMVFGSSFAQEVMAYKGWCLKGYSELPARGNDDVRSLSFLCKQ